MPSRYHNVHRKAKDDEMPHNTRSTSRPIRPLSRMATYDVSVDGTIHNPYSRVVRDLHTDADLTHYMGGEVPLYVYNKAYDAITLGTYMYAEVYHRWGVTHEYTMSAYRLQQSLIYWTRCQKIATSLTCVVDEYSMITELSESVGFATALGDNINQVCDLMVKSYAYTNDCEIPNAITTDVIELAMNNFIPRALLESLTRKLEQYRRDAEFIFVVTGHDYRIRD